MRFPAEGYRRLSRGKGVVVLQRYSPAQPAQPSTLHTDTSYFSIQHITGSASIYVPVQLDQTSSAVTWMRIDNPVAGVSGEGYVYVNGYKVILQKVNAGSPDEYWGYPVSVTTGHPAIPAKPEVPEITVPARKADWKFFGYVGDQLLYGDGGLSFSVPSADGSVLVGLTPQTNQLNSAKTASDFALRFTANSVSVLRSMNALPGYSWAFQPTDRFLLCRRGDLLTIQHTTAVGDTVRAVAIPGAAPAGFVRPYAALLASNDAIAYTQIVTTTDLMLDEPIPTQGGSVFLMDRGIFADPRATFTLGAFTSKFDVRVEGDAAGALKLTTSFYVPAFPRALLTVGNFARFYAAGEIEASVSGAMSPVTNDMFFTNAWFGPIAPIRMRIGSVYFHARPTPIRTAVDFGIDVKTATFALPHMKDPIASVQPAFDVSFTANDDSLWHFWFGNDPTTFAAAPVFTVGAKVTFQPIHVDFSVGVSADTLVADATEYMSCVTVNTATYAVTHYTDIHIAEVVPVVEGGKQWFWLHDQYGRGFFRLEWEEEPPYDVTAPGALHIPPIPVPFNAMIDFGASDFGSSARKNVDSMWAAVTPVKELEYTGYVYDSDTHSYAPQSFHERFSEYSVTATTYDESQNPTPIAYPVMYYDPTSRAVFGRGVFTKEWGVRMGFSGLRCGFVLDFVELSVNNGSTRRSYG